MATQRLSMLAGVTVRGSDQVWLLLMDLAICTFGLIEHVFRQKQTNFEHLNCKQQRHTKVTSWFRWWRVLGCGTKMRTTQITLIIENVHESENRVVIQHGNGLGINYYLKRTLHLNHISIPVEWKFYSFFKVKHCDFKYVVRALSMPQFDENILGSNLSKDGILAFVWKLVELLLVFEPSHDWVVIY